MSDRSDQEMRDLESTSTPVREPARPTGQERTGDVLVRASSLLFWCAIWFYFEGGKAERRRERDLARDAV